MTCHTHIPDDLRATVEAAAHSLSPDVVRIRYTVGEDWRGDPAIHFHVVLSDAASRRCALPAVTNRVEAALHAKLDFDAMGLYPYHNYRSVSEQAQVRDPDWE